MSDLPVDPYDRTHVLPPPPQNRTRAGTIGSGKNFTPWLEGEGMEENTDPGMAGVTFMPAIGSPSLPHQVRDNLLGSLSAGDGPFSTTVIPVGYSRLLTQEEVDAWNQKYGY